MNKKIDKILEIWHKHFLDEDKHYSEFEHSDIEYFVGCLLYNHLCFKKAVATMKTIDLSYDFLKSCGDEYDVIQEIVKSIDIKDEKQKIEFLQTFLDDVKKKYTQDELYLIHRLDKHLLGITQRFERDEELKSVSFVAPKAPSPNPLER